MIFSPSNRGETYFFFIFLSCNKKNIKIIDIKITIIAFINFTLLPNFFEYTKIKIVMKSSIMKIKTLITY